jgi:hypothetical protein
LLAVPGTDTRLELATGLKTGKITRLGKSPLTFSLKDYLKKKETGFLAVNQTQQRYANALKRVRNVS